MTDDLVKRLRKFRPTYGWPEEYAITPKQNLNDEAADRIEALEAALREIAECVSEYSDAFYIAHITLEGEKKDE